MKKCILVPTILVLLLILNGCGYGTNAAPAGTHTIPATDTSFNITPSLQSVRSTPPKGRPPTALSPQSKLNGAVVIFTFDDGPVSDYLLAYPILKKHDIRGTSYILPKYIDCGMTWKLTWDEVKEMTEHGWAFGCHTYEHLRLSKASDDQIRKSMEAVNKSFINEGLSPPEIMAYPYGANNQRVINAIRPYRKQARLAYYRTDFADKNHMDPYRIPSISADMQSTSQLKKVKKLVDKACKQNAIIVFRVHTLYRDAPYDTVQKVANVPSGGAPQTSSKLFEMLVQYCIDKGCSFMTMTELLGAYT